MPLQTVRAIYKEGRVIFVDPDSLPADGAEIVIIYERSKRESISVQDPIRALRGRGRGEQLVEKLLESRAEDLEKDERSHRQLRAGT